MSAAKTASPKQKEVLDSLKGGRLVKIENVNGKKKVVLTTASGKAVNGAPKLDRAAVEACQKYGWVSGVGAITESGTAAKKPKKAAVAAK